ncbi:MAG: PilT/PilU family type 4a pilus ATPase [Deltaproteobacteria bacterium]|nr:PilT/PilU family type 4a pilus ATPase [Deltaproteobacteria bacterium]
MEVIEMLAEVLARGGSDLHLVAGAPPMARVHGSLVKLERPALDAQSCDRIVRAMLPHHHAETLDREWQASVSLEFEDPRTQAPLGHFRVSVHLREGVAEAAIRVTPRRVRTPDELGVPPVLKDLALRDTGLILITGPTGQGKTTTFNALVDHINQRRKVKIVTIEDPVEYRHPHGQAVVVQLEVGRDTKTFADALRHALREDPDVICVGEMRDLETIATALTAAETGHLVLATLHTPSAVGTLSRIIDVFPAAQQDQVKTQLSSVLTAVIAQRLLPRADGRGRALATEVLVCTDAVRNQIREEKYHQVQNVMATSRAMGMQRLEDHLRQLLEAGIISRAVAASAANDVRAIQDLL